MRSAGFIFLSGAQAFASAHCYLHSFQRNAGFPRSGDSFGRSIKHAVRPIPATRRISTFPLPDRLPLLPKECGFPTFRRLLQKEFRRSFTHAVRPTPATKRISTFPLPDRLPLLPKECGFPTFRRLLPKEYQACRSSNPSHKTYINLSAAGRTSTPSEGVQVSRISATPSEGVRHHYKRVVYSATV